MSISWACCRHEILEEGAVSWFAGFSDLDLVTWCLFARFRLCCCWVLFRGLGYPQLWPSPQCNEPLDVSKEFTFDVIDGILKGLLYSVLPCVSVIFNFQHSQWYFLFSPFLLSYHDINRRSFIIICIYIPSQQSAHCEVLRCTTFPVLSGYVDKVDPVHAHHLFFLLEEMMQQHQDQFWLEIK